MNKNTRLEGEPFSVFEIKLIESTVEKRNELIAIAKERAKLVIQTAEQECMQIRAQLDDHISQNEDVKIQALRDRIIGGTQLEGRRILMRAREDVISTVFKNVENRLKEIVERRDENFKFEEILSKLLTEAVLAIGGKNFLVSANKRDSDLLEKNRSEIVSTIQNFLGEVNLQVLNKPIDTIGGVIVQNIDGTKVYHNTLEGRLKTVRNRSEARVAKILEVL